MRAVIVGRGCGRGLKILERRLVLLARLLRVLRLEPVGLLEPLEAAVQRLGRRGFGRLFRRVRCLRLVAYGQKPAAGRNRRISARKPRLPTVVTCPSPCLVKCYCSALTQLRRLSSWLAVAGLLVACPRPAEPSLGQSPTAPDRFQQWLAAIDAHKPGDPGKIAVDVSTWTGPELEAVVAEAKRHARTLAKTESERANQILLRGAALHADIGRLIPEDTVRRSPTQKTAYIVRDGRWLGVRYISMHWQLGRSLLDGVDAGARGAPRRARLVPGDVGGLAADAPVRGGAGALRARAPDFSFGSGHSVCAAACCTSGSARRRFRRPPSRSPSRTARLRRSARRAASSCRAERFFRDSLVHRPGPSRGARAPRARARRPRAARRGVGRAAPRDCGRRERCSFCISRELFLGRAEEALGHDEAARAAFERASALYPNAQSPRLALSQIARRAGNRAAAQRELQAHCGAAR